MRCESGRGTDYSKNVKEIKLCLCIVAELLGGGDHPIIEFEAAGVLIRGTQGTNNVVVTAPRGYKIIEVTVEATASTTSVLNSNTPDSLYYKTDLDKTNAPYDQLGYIGGIEVPGGALGYAPWSRTITSLNANSVTVGFYGRHPSAGAYLVGNVKAKAVKSE